MLDEPKKLDLVSAFAWISMIIITLGFLIILGLAVFTDRIDLDWGWGLTLIGLLLLSFQFILGFSAQDSRYSKGLVSAAILILGGGLAKISESSLLSDFLHVVAALVILLVLMGLGRWWGHKLKELAPVYSAISIFVIVLGVLTVIVWGVLTDRIDSDSLGWGLTLIGFAVAPVQVVVFLVAPKRGIVNGGSIFLIALGLANISEPSILSGFFYVTVVLFFPLQYLQLLRIGEGRDERNKTRVID